MFDGTTTREMKVRQIIDEAPVDAGTNVEMRAGGDIIIAGRGRVSGGDQQPPQRVQVPGPASMPACPGDEPVTDGQARELRDLVETICKLGSHSTPYVFRCLNTQMNANCFRAIQQSHFAEAKAYLAGWLRRIQYPEDREKMLAQIHIAQREMVKSWKLHTKLKKMMGDEAPKDAELGELAELRYRNHLKSVYGVDSSRDLELEPLAQFRDTVEAWRREV